MDRARRLLREGIDDRQGFDLLARLQVLDVERPAAGFECRSKDQRVEGGVAPPVSNRERAPIELDDVEDRAEGLENLSQIDLGFRNGDGLLEPLERDTQES